MRGHRTDPLSLVFGLLFVMVALWWLLTQVLHIGLPAFGWILAAALVLLGGLGLIGALRGARARGGRDRDTE